VKNLFIAAHMVSKNDQKYLNFSIFLYIESISLISHSIIYSTQGGFLNRNEFNQ